MRVLILGVNGFLGRAVAASAASRGATTFGLSRSEGPRLAIRATYRSGDRRTPGLVRSLVDELAIDVVVDVVAYTHRDTVGVVQQLDGCSVRYVMLSSCDVYRNYELLHRRATGTPEATPAREDSRLRTTRYLYRTEPRRSPSDPESWLDEYDKIPIEETVANCCSDWTILRLPMVYGPGDPQRRFRWAIRHFSGAPDNPLVLRSPWASWATSYGYVDDVGDGIALAAGHPKARNRVFNLGEARGASQLEWARRIARAVGWSGIVAEDSSASRPPTNEGMDFAVPLLASSERIRSELGFRETVTLSERIAGTIADERTRG